MPHTPTIDLTDVVPPPDVEQEQDLAVPFSYMDHELVHLEDYQGEQGELGNEAQYYGGAPYVHPFSPSPPPPAESTSEVNRTGPFSPSSRHPGTYTPISPPRETGVPEDIVASALDFAQVNAEIALVDEEVAARLGLGLSRRGHLAS